MSIFDEVKSRLDMRSVAVEYGFTPNRSDYIHCPFHSEKTPSMRLYEQSFYCFGCGIGGDVIKFVMKLFELSAIDAVKKLNSDFTLNLIVDCNDIELKETAVNMAQLMRYYMDWEKWAFLILNGYYKLLMQWYKLFSPKTPEDTPYHLWLRACYELPVIHNYCMILINGSDDERKSFYINYRREVDRVAGEYEKYIGN